MAALPLSLRSRVGRRIVGSFILSALVPVGALAIISLFAVVGQLKEQSRERLAQLARNGGQSILQQLNLVEGAFRFIVSDEPSGGVSPVAMAAIPAIEAAWLEDGGELVDYWPPSPEPPARATLLAPSEADLARGEYVVGSGLRAGTILLGRRLGDRGRPNQMAWVRLSGDSIWGPARTFTDLPNVTDFCVLGQDGVPLFCRSGGGALASAFVAQASAEHFGTFSVSPEGERSLLAYWSFHPMGAFSAAPWTVLVAESEESVYAPLNGFVYTLLAVLAVGLSVVVLLANVQIRRTMEPLVALREGTGRIAGGDFGSEVELTSSDEFGELASSFNVMVRHIRDQFAQLQAGRAIDRAVLGAFDREEVLRAILTEVPQVVRCRSAATLLVAETDDPSAIPMAEFHWLTGQTALGGRTATLLEADLEWLRTHAYHGTSAEEPAAFLDAVCVGIGSGPRYGFPFRVKGRVRGALILEVPHGSALDDEQVRVARRLANQAAIALEDIRLVGELEDMSWGGIRALARAIDAKSPWTTGHSERVTQVALALGREMELPAHELDQLHRGGLLHDIGKIGVPSAILNADRRLTDEEAEQVRRHPEIGARIIEPIRAYLPIVPLVLQHHERWDGRGYPAGLAGEEIHPLARILAVADTYDAMVSARPYRAARPLEATIAEIVGGAGSQFEPRVVRAFVAFAARATTTERSLEKVHA